MSSTPPDDDNPAWTAEEIAQARPASEVLPQFIGKKAAQELLRPAGKVLGERGPRQK